MKLNPVSIFRSKTKQNSLIFLDILQILSS